MNTSTARKITTTGPTISGWNPSRMMWRADLVGSYACFYSNGSASYRDVETERHCGYSVATITLADGETMTIRLDGLTKVTGYAYSMYDPEYDSLASYPGTIATEADMVDLLDAVIAWIDA